MGVRLRCAGNKQNEETCMHFGNGLGKAMEVEVPFAKQDMNEFLRVRVDFPTAGCKRLQTRITIGLKGKPQEVTVYKLKYERVPHYCSHCGFMGHCKEECEKKRKGIPSLDYDVYELRCSPYKKHVHRAHFMPPPGHVSAKRGLSFTSFGSAESRKSPQPRGQARGSFNQGTRKEQDGFEEEQGTPMTKIEQNLSAQVGSMQVNPNEQVQEHVKSPEVNTKQPIIQFPDEEEEQGVADGLNATHALVQQTGAKRQKKPGKKASQKPLGPITQYTSPHSSDMIPALHGLSGLVVSYGDSDETMQAVDFLPRKRTVTETDNKVMLFGKDLSLVPFEAKVKGGEQKRGRTKEGEDAAQTAARRAARADQEATGPGLPAS
ncbi:hypothetical protein ACQ4PT_051504 [Festuca glaucescens]